MAVTANPDGRAPIKELAIRHEDRVNSYSFLDVLINEQGDLRLDGVDGSPMLEKSWGDFDYEFSWTVPAEWKDTVLLHLMKERFPKESEFSGWCEERGIPVRGFYWH
jgi:hypothetical protein